MQGLSHLLQVATPGLGSWNIWLIWRQVISSKNGVDQDVCFFLMINSNVVLSQDDEYPKMDQRAFFVSIGENDDRPWDGNCVHHSWNLFHHDGQKQKPMVISMKRIVPNWIDIYIYICMCVFMLSIVFLWTCDKQVRVLYFQSHRIPWEIRSPSADPIHPATEVAGPWLWQIWTFTPKPFWAKAARTLVLWLSLQRPSRNHRDCAWNCRIYNAYIYIYTDMMMMMITMMMMMIMMIMMIIVMIIVILIVIIMMTTKTIILMMIITILVTIYN